MMMKESEKENEKESEEMFLFRLHQFRTLILAIVMEWLSIVNEIVFSICIQNDVRNGFCSPHFIPFYYNNLIQNSIDFITKQISEVPSPVHVATQKLHVGEKLMKEKHFEEAVIAYSHAILLLSSTDEVFHFFFLIFIIEI
jgi:hypothetical protein